MNNFQSFFVGVSIVGNEGNESVFFRGSAVTREAREVERTV